MRDFQDEIKKLNIFRDDVKVSSRTNIESQLTDVLRIENKTRRLQKLPAGFYDSVKAAFESVDAEANDALEREDINLYGSLRMERSKLENNFMAFFQKRWEKIAAISQYDLDQSLISSLSSQEMAAALEFKAVYSKYYNQSVGEGKQ